VYQVGVRESQVGVGVVVYQVGLRLSQVGVCVGCPHADGAESFQSWPSSSELEELDELLDELLDEELELELEELEDGIEDDEDDDDELLSTMAAALI